MSKTIIVSNRLPVNIKIEEGHLTVNASAGGLATALSSMMDAGDFIWIGWPGSIFKDEIKPQVELKLSDLKLFPVFLSKSEVKNFYEGFSNSVLWPNFHYFPQYIEYNKIYWEAYKSVNIKFCAAIAALYQKGDRIWVQDYHLLLLPELLRKKFPEATIGFFQHIPFPSFEIFRMLPWRTQIIKGMLGADLIGFHTYDDVRYFLDSVNSLLGIEHTMMEFRVNNRAISVDAFPIGIDYQKFAKGAASAEALEAVNKLRANLQDVKLILSVDRLDYSKGISERLRAYDMLLQSHPEYKEKITLILLVVPSRDTVTGYKYLKEEIDHLVGNINGKFGSPGWTPIQYFYKNFSFDWICALYRTSDIALITPIRDGMNLVCKEYVACRVDKTGVLILSERAGAAKTLNHAVRVNPNNVDEIANALIQAIEMPLEHQIERMSKMQMAVSKYDVVNWLHTFFQRLTYIKNKQLVLNEKIVGNELLNKIFLEFQSASNRLLIFDYDGVLIPYHDDPSRAIPDTNLIHLVTKLATNSKNKVILTSGRNRDELEQWFLGVNVGLISEHGLWRKEAGAEWIKTEDISVEWKRNIESILQEFVDRTPGSYIELKNNSLSWHHRLTDSGLGDLRAREISTTLKFLSHNLNLEFYEGDKVIEIKNSLINKSKAYKTVTENTKYDLVFTIGIEDKDLAALPENTISLNVGESTENAMYSIPSWKEVRILLQFLSSDNIML